MGQTCVTAAAWLAALPVNWDAVAAIATVAATIVALFLPGRTAAKEWARQDKLRAADESAARDRDAAIHHEIASAVDRILAYRDAAIAIFDSEPVYTVGVQAAKRIGLNAQILVDLLGLLQGRPALSDGALYAALAAQRIARDVIQTTSAVVGEWGTANPTWVLRKALLTRHDELAQMAKTRIDGVRLSYGLPPSQSAAEVRAKYLTLADQIVAAKHADSGPPPDTLGSSYL